MSKHPFIIKILLLILMSYSWNTTFSQGRYKKIDVRHGINDQVAYNYFSDIAFVDDMKGWAVGSNGMIKQTKDGGITWINQESPIKKTLWQLQFVNKDNGWILGESNTLLRTNNGGKTWSDITPQKKLHIFTCHFQSPQKGWISTLTGILETNDGGNTWKNIHEIKEGYFSKIIFPDPQTGFMLTNDGFLKTKDGGKSWNFIKVSSSQKCTLTNMSFYDSLNGVLVANFPDLLFFTQDGGKTWTEKKGIIDQSESAEDYHTFSVYYLNANKILMSNYYVLYESINQGETWTKKMDLTEFRGAEFKFTSSTNGYMISGLELHKTTDAGHTWKSINYDLLSTLNDIFFIDPKTGWSVGERGTILL